MSNYYRYHCMDCDESFKPSNLNNGEKQMIAVLQHKKALAVLVDFSQEPYVWDFYVNVSSGHTVPVKFLYEHLEHHLVVLSEYRDHYYEEDGTLHEKQVP